MLYKDGRIEMSIGATPEHVMFADKVLTEANARFLRQEAGGIVRLCGVDKTALYRLLELTVEDRMLGVHRAELIEVIE